ncbi:vanZ like family protein [Sarocladium implicatum]|nr:vanZ like family protein [Sarocladium implicatum]
MRIRLPFAGVFLLLLLIAGYAGLTPLQLGQYIDDKLLHFITFFLLTIVFYWVVDTNRRRTLNMTLMVCTLLLGVGSEFLQGFLPNGRDFDLYDIAANVIGSLAGLGLCTWYHKRMLERKRQRKTYNAVPGEDDGDVELGEGHESGIIDAAPQARTLEQEVDNWDEHAVDDWDDGDPQDDPVISDTNGKNPEPGKKD